MNNHFKLLETNLSIKFKDRLLLENAFVHRSYLNEHKSHYLPSNEKLEFLGDSVLSLATSIYLYKHFPSLDEGAYTDIKASIVRMESLAEAAKKLELGKYLFLSKGEEQNGGRENTNILADCLESFIGALFLDKGFEVAYEFIHQKLFKDKLDYIVEHMLYLSPKSRVQEIIQATYRSLPHYEILSEKGPEHKKEFIVAVSFNQKKLGEGKGSSKKEAEENAAKDALEFLTKKDYNI